MKRHNKFPKFLVRQITTTLSLGLLLASACTRAQSVKQYLRGSQLVYIRITYFSDTKTTVNFCHNGRYSLSRKGGWSVNGGIGASNKQETGRWDIKQQDDQIMLVYASDRGEKRAFPIYVENKGRVNIGKKSYDAKRGGAKC